MLDVLEVYERPYDSLYPVVCLDEKSYQLLGESRTSIPMQPGSKTKHGKPTRHNYEYKRNGTCNLFVAIEPKAAKRYVRVTKHRKKKDYASFVKYLVTKVYKKAKKIILVEDNLNTHNKKSLIEAFGEKEGKKLARKIEWHFTPKHASWLDQAEIEIHALAQQCLSRRIQTIHLVQSEVAACVKKRNEQGCGVNWQFTREKAKQKFYLA